MVGPGMTTLPNFYPRSPCGERRCSCTAHSRRSQKISIHALLAESDSAPPRSKTSASLFLSTLSLRRATMAVSAQRGYEGISIHALLAESDRFGFGKRKLDPYFYPRSPCGERHVALCGYERTAGFLSTLSLRRATHICGVAGDRAGISIHALLAESDFNTTRVGVSGKLFLSTLSLRRATHGQPVFAV